MDMIDEVMKVWQIEINVNPALTTNTNTLMQAITSVVQESICKFLCNSNSLSIFCF